VAKNKQKSDNLIILNKKAKFDYFIKQSYEAGISLLGWEVKSLREKKVQLKESYIILKNNELFLFNANITPQNTASTHVDANNTRTRKLLLHRSEISNIKEDIQQKGGTAVPLRLYWLRGKVKLEIGVAFGKKQADKRQDIKERDWKREKDRELKQKNR
jgi:SsrA-binding protein